jgi:hypothetical protein
MLSIGCIKKYPSFTSIFKEQVKFSTDENFSWRILAKNMRYGELFANAYFYNNANKQCIKKQEKNVVAFFRVF